MMPHQIFHTSEQQRSNPSSPQSSSLAVDRKLILGTSARALALLPRLVGRLSQPLQQSCVAPTWALRHFSAEFR